MYAIVKSGGRQEKVSAGDVFELDRQVGAPGSTLQLPAVLLVDGATVTTDAAALATVKVTAEVLEHTKGPKIEMIFFKNKTGHRVRKGHRQKLTRIKITSIEK
ncbi:MAG TPA: 50S ribosomal protein L21 [Sporichthyaceae bacterium]